MRTLLSQIQEIKTATSKRGKLLLLKRHDSPALRQLLFNAFSPTVVLGLGKLDYDSETREHDEHTETSLTDLLMFIRQVQARDIKGNASKDAALKLANLTPFKYRWIVAGILGGDLRIGCDAKDINKAIPDLIPTLNLQEAEELHPDHLNFPGYASMMLGGMRCLAIVTRHGVRLFSKGGNAIESVPHIESALKRLPVGYYDGELLHPSGHKVTIHFCRHPRPRFGHTAVQFFISDFIAESEWNDPRMPAKERFQKLERAFDSVDTSVLRMVPHTLVYRNSDLLRLHRQFIAAGREGTLFQTTGAYVRRKGWHIQKLKDFKASEGEVVELKVAKTGKHKGTVSSVRLRDLQTGVEFDLGSGFTDDEIDELGPSALGSIIEYRYQELSEARIPRSPSFLRYRPN